MLKIAIIIGSTRPGRNSEKIATWVYKTALKRNDAEFEIVDIKDYDLPLFDEPNPPLMKQYTHEHTKRWSEKIKTFDGFIFITPEYNHGPSAALKNAMDFLSEEWENKVAGFVSYGSMGGVCAVEHLRSIAGILQMADVKAQLALSLYTDFINLNEFKPLEIRENQLNIMIDQMILWGNALKTIRK